MGYRDDFYVVGNIVGYTGEINSSLTVYFNSSTEYGRITQTHKKADNIGRNKVRSNAGHTMQNEDYDGKYRLVERINGDVTHKSRNVFYPVNTLTQGDRDVLAQSILNFEEAKPR